MNSNFWFYSSGHCQKPCLPVLPICDLGAAFHRRLLLAATKDTNRPYGETRFRLFGQFQKNRSCKIIVAKELVLLYNRQEYWFVAMREATVWMFFRELIVGENQQAEVPFHFLSIDESQRLVSFNVPTRGCYRFSYLRQGRLMYLDMFI